MGIILPSWLENSLIESYYIALRLFLSICQLRTLSFSKFQKVRCSSPDPWTGASPFKQPLSLNDRSHICITIKSKELGSFWKLKNRAPILPKLYLENQGLGSLRICAPSHTFNYYTNLGSKSHALSGSSRTGPLYYHNYTWGTRDLVAYKFALLPIH